MTHLGIDKVNKMGSGDTNGNAKTANDILDPKMVFLPLELIMTDNNTRSEDNHNINIKEAKRLHKQRCGCTLKHDCTEKLVVYRRGPGLKQSQRVCPCLQTGNSADRSIFQ